MSAVQNSSLLPPLRLPATWFPPIQAQSPSLPPLAPPPLLPPQPAIPNHGRIVFTRQLWQRTMPEGPTEHCVSTRSHSQGSIQNHGNASLSRRASPNISTRSLRSASSPSGGSKTPLTPEESPPFRTTRKRNASVVEDEDKRIDGHDATPIHSRVNSGDSASHVCLCQPEPKIPRPRNAFILYRQHHQANVVAQHPGLANPEISKIIGEQWRNQAQDVKNEWKALAEEEKLRHQQQYPDYRYQPKRNGRRNSLTSDTPGSATSEKPRCNKCGGRTILAPSSVYASSSQATSPLGTGIPPNTPGSAITPVSRTLPILRDLSLQSPAVRRLRQNNMSPSHYYDERDDIGPLSPENKRRRFNGEHPPIVHRIVPPRYGTAPPPGMQVGPGTPFPFGQGQPVPHQYAPVQTPAMAHTRRESLPGLRGMVSPPGVMAPPPKPGMGYQQHRLSQGHIAHDRSLTLAPLQTGNTQPATPKPKGSTSKSMEDIIMELPFHYKLKVLRQIAPPAPMRKTTPRGPLITIEGENTEAVHELSKWLVETLSKDSDLNVKLLDGPDVTAKGAREDAMAEYHALAGSWLGKSKDIVQQLEYSLASAPPIAQPTTAMDTTATTPASSHRDIDENYCDTDSPSKPSQPSKSTEPMDLDPTTSSKKPTLVLPLFSLHASNTFACRIPITDPYAPNDHWQWSATQWRGVVGPDLTIYVRDGAEGKSVEQSEEEKLFVVRRGRREDGTWEIENATARRVGFEVGEWVRGFGGR